MTWLAKYVGTCPSCRGRIEEKAPVDWSRDGTAVIHDSAACRAHDPTRRPAVCPVHGLTLPATGICDDCA